MKNIFYTFLSILIPISLAAQFTGTVSSYTKINSISGGFTGQLDGGDQFGRDVANIGDLNGDGVEDIAVGARLDDDGGFNPGAVWILFLNTDGTVNSHQKISIGNGGFTGIPTEGFGSSVALIGDLNGDGVQDIAVGEDFSDDGAYQAGAIWILFMNTNGTVNAHQKISSTTGGLNINLNANGRFGNDITGMGDLDNDGVLDIAVSQYFNSTVGSAKGAVWILFLNINGTVKARQEIRQGAGGFTATLWNNDRFGSSIACLGDFDNDGVTDLLVGSDGRVPSAKGAVWLLFLNTNGTVKSYQEISDTQGGFSGVIGNSDNFGSSVDTLGDIDGDNIMDIAVGAYNDDDGGINGGSNRGAVYIIFLNANGTIKGHQKISDTQGNFTGQLNDGDYFGGRGISVLNDLNNDGTKDLAVCAYLDGFGPNEHGAVWILFLNCDFQILPDVYSSINIGNDTILCGSATLQLDATTTDATDYLWQDGSTNATFTVTQPGTYYVTVSNDCNVGTDTIYVQYVNSQLSVNLGIDTVLCIGETITLDVTNPAALTYLWQDSSTNATFDVIESGTYHVTVADECIAITDTITVLITNIPPNSNLGNDTILCQGTELILDGFSPIANTYLWSDGSTNSTLIVSDSGQYIVTSTNNCGSTNDTVNIELIISELAVDLGSDTTLCIGDILTLDAFAPTAISYLWQDSSTNSTFEVAQTGTYKVSVSDICITITDSIFIEYITLEVNMGNDTAICEGRTVLLDVTHPNAENYLWQDGSINSFFSVFDEGQFFVTLENHCEAVSDTINVILSTPILVTPNLGNDQLLCPGQTIILDATTENALNYIWQDSTEGATYMVTEPGFYEVTVSNSCLSRTDDIVFIADACCNLFVPDAFTPNNDGNNDNFHAFTNCEVTNFSMMIFDRWGGKIFETTDINQGWNGMKNGQLLDTGVYVYIISFDDGFTTRKQEGSITLIR